MTKAKLYLVTLIMTISLAGLLIIQLMWIRNAMKIKQSEYEDKIVLVLENVVKKTGFNQKADYIINVVPEDSLSTIATEIRVNVSRNDMDSVKLKKHIVKKPINSDSIEVIWTERSNNSNNIHIYKKNNLKLVEEIVLSDLDSSKSVDVIHNEEGIDIHVNHLVEKVDEEAKKMQHTFRKLAFEYIIDTLPLERLLDKEEIVELLQDELYRANIKTSFQWKIVVPQDSSKVLMHSDNFNIRRTVDSFRVNLFPDKVYAKAAYLVLVPEKRFLHSLTYLTGIHFSSLIFSIIIVLAYLFTYRLLLRQKKVSEIKTDFINNMTHEFKTPIATINLAADSINSPSILKSEDKIKHFTSIIKEESNRMNHQVEKVLQMSVLEKHELCMHMERLDLHSVVEQVTKSFNLILQKREGNIQLNLNAGESEVYADEEHLKNALINIVDNAIKYSPNKPIVGIETELSGNTIKLSVTDEGIGIPKKDQELIFDRFFRVHTGDLHDVKGFGVGLNYVKEVVLKMNGKIHLESEEGRGSTFTLLFKLAYE